MIEKCLFTLRKPEHLKDFSQRCFIYSLVVGIIFLSVIFFLNIYLYSNLFKQVNNLFFANGAVSDIMQCT